MRIGTILSQYQDNNRLQPDTIEEALEQEPMVEQYSNNALPKKVVAESTTVSYP